MIAQRRGGPHGIRGKLMILQYQNVLSWRAWRLGARKEFAWQFVFPILLQYFSCVFVVLTARCGEV